MYTSFAFICYSLHVPEKEKKGFDATIYEVFFIFIYFQYAVNYWIFFIVKYSHIFPFEVDV